ncbi:Suppressor of fused protein (SUFU) [Rhodococcus sp. EPR-157]|uniref:suppressor of fused domain protein n=1 Tax=Rhodococcus sp. EPR-157 TaxID=1813677 RepID=UPI0007BC3A25|nr:suppressor of fused domain protein [Rhodococcus sp. EPR-157]KZF11736.1 Suppressor of fused protein (SUFU) [Rhodococcus sp. EPR-157]
MDFVSDGVIGSVIARVRAHLIAEIGDENPSSASVTFLGLEALDVLRFAAGEEDLVRYVTLGCSRHPMADPNEMVADQSRGPRAELILTLRGGAGVASGVHTKLAVLAASPAVEGVVLVTDALLDLGEPLWVGSPFTAVLLGDSDIPDLQLPEPADPVKFLQVVPITGTEAAWVRLRGADALRDAWNEAGIDVRDPSRSAVNL